MELTKLISRASRKPIHAVMTSGNGGPLVVTSVNTALTAKLTNDDDLLVPMFVRIVSPTSKPEFKQPVGRIGKVHFHPYSESVGSYFGCAIREFVSSQLSGKPAGHQLHVAELN